MATTKLTQKPLPVNVMVALYDFQARDPDEITIKEKQLLYLVEEKGKSDEWARVRLTVDGSKGEGLVPWTYIAPKKPLYRANALYRFTRQKIDEVDMALGQNVSVYGSLDAFYLVKVDSSASRQAAVGFIPGNYIEEWPTGER
ncbi:cytoskeletal protein binding protein, partial [Tulasnella sp. 427]